MIRNFHLNTWSSMKRLNYCPYASVHALDAAFRTKKRICKILFVHVLLCIVSILNFHRKPKRLHRISAVIFYPEIFYTCIHTVEYYYASGSRRALSRRHPSLSPRGKSFQLSCIDLNNQRIQIGLSTMTDNGEWIPRLVSISASSFI